MDLRQQHPIRLRINGQDREFDVESWVTLPDLLRERAGLTGTKKSCDHGQCGACTVLLDGRRVNSCLTLAVMQDGHEITTVEGLAKGEELHPLQQAFIDCDAFQCGYCTPGQICSAVQVLFADEDDRVVSKQLGAKGVGEIGIVGVAAAISNAISHATGKRLRSTPMSPDKLLLGDQLHLDVR